MSLSVNGHSRVPPGFRFHPTEEELLDYYLRKKAAHQMIDLDVISDVDLNKLEPWDIQEKCRIGSTPQNDWYFFSHKDKKYPTGTRTNRATAAGFWKATGRDKIIYSSFKRIGMRKTLVFYKGRAPHGQRSGWIMHEYRLDDQKDTNAASKASSWAAETAQEDGWVVCRVFKKKYLHKTQDSTYESSVTNEINTQMLHSSISDEPLDQILEYVGQKCKPENESNSNNNVRFLAPIEQTISTGVPEPFMQLPQLESPTLPRIKHISNQSFYTPVISDVDALTNNEGNGDLNPVYQVEAGVNNWATLDRLVACHLNGQADASQQLAFFNDLNLLGQDRDHSSPNICSLTNQLFNSSQDYNNDVDLWGFTHSAFDLHLN